MKDRGWACNGESRAEHAHLSVVNVDDGANHLGHDNHVTQMSLNDGGLLIGGSLFLSLAELLDEPHGAPLEAALEPAARTRVDDLCRVFCGMVRIVVREKGDESGR